MSRDATSADPLPVPAPRGDGEREDADLVARLRAGDEAAFVTVVAAWSPVMLRVARLYVSTDASAEEIVQEAWLAVLRGLARFEGRSSLRTWVLRILTNQAKSRGVREARSVPFSSLEGEDGGSGIDPERFRGPEDAWPGHWTPAGAPQPFEPTPESAVLATEVRGLLGAALELLPERQRTVVTLRDVHGLPAEDVCEILGLSAANQRVLLHRGRSRLRAALEDYYRTPAGATP